MLLRNTTESALYLMEMTEVERPADKTQGTVKEMLIEEKIFLCLGYLMGALILDAHELETQEKRERSTKNKKYWLSEMKIVRQLIITRCNSLNQYDTFYT